MIAETENDPTSTMYFKGYYNNKDATNKKLIPNAFKKGDW